MIKSIQFQIYRKSQSLSLTKKRLNTLKQHQNKLFKAIKQKNTQGNELNNAKKQVFLKTPKQCYKLYSSYSRNSLNVINKKQRLLINNINHNKKSMNNTPLNSNESKYYFMCLNFDQNSFKSSQKRKVNAMQTNMEKQNALIPTFSSLKRPKYLSLAIKDKKRNNMNVIERKSQRIKSENFQTQPRRMENFQFENNNMIKKIMKRKKQYEIKKKNQIQNIFFPLVKKSKLNKKLKLR